LETRAKPVNKQQAVQLSRNVILHILLLFKLYYCYYYFLKMEILYNISIKCSTYVPAWRWNLFVIESRRSWNKVVKFCRPGQATNSNMEHAYFMLDA